MSAVSPASNTTVNLLIDWAQPYEAFAASVVQACSPSTTYAVQCTSGPAEASTCGSNAPISTITAGPSNYYRVFSTVWTSTDLISDFTATSVTHTQTNTGTETGYFSCTILPGSASAAVCDDVDIATWNGVSLSALGTTTLTRNVVPVTITAGAASLTNTAACGTTTSAPTTTTSTTTTGTTTGTGTGTGKSAGVMVRPRVWGLLGAVVVGLVGVVLAV